MQFDQTSAIPTPYVVHLCSLLEIACQPNAEVKGISSVGKKKRLDDDDFDEREEEEEERKKYYDAENAYESLTLKFRKKIVRFVTKEVLMERGKTSSSNGLVLCEPDSEEFWRRVYRFFVLPSSSKTKKKTKKNSEEEEEEEMEVSRANNNNGYDEYEEEYADNDDDDDDETRCDKAQQIEDFFHVLQTKEKYLLESVDELVRKFERLPRCLAREARDCFAVSSGEDLAVRKIDPESVCGRFLRRQLVEFERLSFDGVCECHEMLRRYREDFDAFVNAAAEEMNGGEKGEVTFLLHRTSKANERAIVDTLVEKCERLGVKKSSANEEESNDEEDETLPFGIAMGLGGILDPREKDNSTRNTNSRSNSGNSGFPTKNNKSVGAVLRNHRRSTRCSHS